MGTGHGHGHGVSAGSDRRLLAGALTLLLTFMAAEVVVGLLSGSLALLSDAAHMLTDAFSIVLALVAMRLATRPPVGGYTFGLKRSEILSAQLNGLTLILLAVYFGYEAVHRLIDPPAVAGTAVLGTALAGIVINLMATWLIRRADRTSLNVEGAFQHILNDLYAFVATAIAGLTIWVTGFARADAAASLIITALMIKAGYGLIRSAGRILMEAAPTGMDPAEIGTRLAQRPCVVEVHDLHVWEVTSGYAAMSAHVLVEPGGDCHAVRRDLRSVLFTSYGISHATLEVDHAHTEDSGTFHCEDPHGPRHVALVEAPHEHVSDPGCGH
jgi:cobalt-zinc-cadmium efflux system protein